MLHSYFIFFKENILFTNNAKHRTLPHFLPVLKPIFPPEQVSAAATPSSSSVNRGKGTNTKHNPSSKQIAGKGAKFGQQDQKDQGVFWGGSKDHSVPQPLWAPLPAPRRRWARRDSWGARRRQPGKAKPPRRRSI